MANFPQYLIRYAEAEVAYLASFPQDIYCHHSVVIPAFNETDEFIKRLRQTPSIAQKTLFIIVINQPDNCLDTTLNQQLTQAVRQLGTTIWRAAHLELIQDSTAHCLWLCVKRYKPGQQIPRKQGVGLARKIGADLSAYLYFNQQLKSAWIYSTDADAHLPEDYLTLPDSAHYAAAVYEFHHRDDGSPTALATMLYEQAIRYYVAGLQWAKSPYGFHTLGSALAINCQAYCDVRGFPKRAGGEDFYLFNKLAKSGDIYPVKHCQIILESRLSQRIPFGTGPAVQNILDGQQSADNYCYYNPAIFQALQQWLEQIENPSMLLDKNSQWLSELPVSTQEALQSLDLNGILRHLDKQASTVADYTKMLHQWFDAFKTLKFIRYLQEHHFAALPLAKCLAHAKTHWSTHWSND